MAGTGQGAELGILFKKAEALEGAARLDTIILDKTGTITEGRPAVSEVLSFDPDAFPEERLLALAASAELGSEHPLGRAVVQEARERGIELVPPTEFRAYGGSGVEALVHGSRVRIGKPSWFGAAITGPLPPEVENLQKQGQTVMVISVDEIPAGLTALSDTLKADSRAAIAMLHRQGLKVVMLTGDNRGAADTIARQTGIDEVYAEVLPQEKSLKVKQIQAQGRRAGMVGDGINDAPALARADIGLAIGTGTDVAIETADIILSGGSLAGIPRAIEISRRTMRTIRQNLFLAFVYNVILIPVAAGILAPVESLPMFIRQLHPILAALAMAMSSISVVSNSLRLHRARIR